MAAQPAISGPQQTNNFENPAIGRRRHRPTYNFSTKRLDVAAARPGGESSNSPYCRFSRHFGRFCIKSSQLRKMILPTPVYIEPFSFVHYFNFFCCIWIFFSCESVQFSNTKCRQQSILLYCHFLSFTFRCIMSSKKLH